MPANLYPVMLLAVGSTFQKRQRWQRRINAFSDRLTQGDTVSANPILAPSHQCFLLTTRKELTKLKTYLVRLGSVIVTAFLLSNTVGYWSIKSEYPERKYHERLHSVYLTNVFPWVCVGMAAGLAISDRILKGSSRQKTTLNYLETRLKDQSLSPIEADAYQQVYADLKSRETELHD